jgi:ElaB/YqjD/DUF883 family membrane-anchored ribosome-binding protein
MADNDKPTAAVKPAAKPRSTTKKPAAASSAAANNVEAASSVVVKATPPKGKTEEVKAKVKADMNDFKAKAADSVRAAAEKGKDRATDAVGSIGKLIRDSAATVDENVGKQYGDYARNAAEMVDGFAGKMSAKDVDAIAEDARKFIRKSPAVAIGAAAAIGFALARLVRSGGKNA